MMLDWFSLPRKLPIVRTVVWETQLKRADWGRSWGRCGCNVPIVRRKTTFLNQTWSLMDICLPPLSSFFPAIAPVLVLFCCVGFCCCYFYVAMIKCPVRNNSRGKEEECCCCCCCCGASFLQVWDPIQGVVLPIVGRWLINNQDDPNSMPRGLSPRWLHILSNWQQPSLCLLFGLPLTTREVPWTSYSSQEKHHSTMSMSVSTPCSLCLVIGLKEQVMETSWAEVTAVRLTPPPCSWPLIYLNMKLLRLRISQGPCVCTYFSTELGPSNWTWKLLTGAAFSILHPCGA